MGQHTRDMLMVALGGISLTAVAVVRETAVGLSEAGLFAVGLAAGVVVVVTGTLLIDLFDAVFSKEGGDAHLR